MQIKDGGVLKREIKGPKGWRLPETPFFLRDGPWCRGSAVVIQELSQIVLPPSQRCTNIREAFKEIGGRILRCERPHALHGQMWGGIDMCLLLFMSDTNCRRCVRSALCVAFRVLIQRVKFWLRTRSFSNSAIR